MDDCTIDTTRPQFKLGLIIGYYHLSKYLVCRLEKVPAYRAEFITCIPGNQSVFVLNKTFHFTLGYLPVELETKFSYFLKQKPYPVSRLTNPGFDADKSNSSWAAEHDP